MPKPVGHVRWPNRHTKTNKHRKKRLLIRYMVTETSKITHRSISCRKTMKKNRIWVLKTSFNLVCSFACYVHNTWPSVNTFSSSNPFCAVAGVGHVRRENRHTKSEFYPCFWSRALATSGYGFWRSNDMYLKIKNDELVSVSKHAEPRARFYFSLIIVDVVEVLKEVIPFSQ